MSVHPFPGRAGEDLELLQPEDLATVAEAAAILGCKAITVRRLIKRGELETLYSGRLLRITRRSLAAYQQRTRRGGRAA